MSFDWGFLLISLIGICSIAVVLAFYRRRFNLLLNTFFNWKLSKQIIRYEKVHSHPVNIILLILFMGFFTLFYALSYSMVNQSMDFLALAQSIGLFLLVYTLAKLALYHFSAWLFDEGEVINLYLFHINLHSKFMGISLLVLWIFLIYAPIPASILLNISLVILVLFLGFQTYRGIVIGRSEGKNLLLIILYLCTLEILPWLLIAKSVKNDW